MIFFYFTLYFSYQLILRYHMDHDDYDAVIVDCKNYGYQYYSDTLLIKPLIGVSNRIIK